MQYTNAAVTPCTLPLYHHCFLVAFGLYQVLRLRKVGHVNTVPSRSSLSPIMITMGKKGI